MAIQYIDVVNGSDTFATVSITGATRADPCVITSSGHGYDNGQLIRITSVGGMSQLNNNVYKTANVAVNTFELQYLDGTNVNSTAYTTYTSGGTVTQWRKIPISGITQANPAVVTAKKHGFSNGNLIIVEDVSGMVEVNNICFTVGNATVDTFELSGIDSSAYVAWSSGGTVTKPFKSPKILDTYRGSIVASSFWSDGDTVKFARTFKYADVVVGSGNIGFTKGSATVTTSIDLRPSISQYDFIGLTSARLDGCQSDPTVVRPDVFYRVEAITASTITLHSRYAESSVVVSTLYRLRPGTEIQTLGTSTGAWSEPSLNVNYEGGYSFNESGAITQDSEVGATVYRPFDSADYFMLSLAGSGNTVRFLNFVNCSRGFEISGSYNTINYCSSYSINIYAFFINSAQSDGSFNRCFGSGSASFPTFTVPNPYSSLTEPSCNYCYAIGVSANTVGFHGSNYSRFNNCCSNGCGFTILTPLGRVYNSVAINSNRTSSYSGFLSSGGYFYNCTADNCSIGFLTAGQNEGHYISGGTFMNCSYGIYASQSSSITIEDSTFMSNVSDFYQDQYSMGSKLINCSSETPGSYMLSRVLNAGPIFASGCSIDALSSAKAFQVISGARYGSPQYLFQNSFGITGQYLSNGYYLEDTTEYRTISPSMKLALNTTIAKSYAPIKIASFYVAGGTAKTVTYYLKRDSGSWEGIITPQLRLNGRLIKTGTDITSLDNDWLTSRTIGATSGEIDQDGELSLEFLYNANNTPIWIDDVEIS